MLLCCLSLDKAKGRYVGLGWAEGSVFLQFFWDLDLAAVQFLGFFFTKFFFFFLTVVQLFFPKHSLVMGKRSDQ